MGYTTGEVLRIEDRAQSAGRTNLATLDTFVLADYKLDNGGTEKPEFKECGPFINRVVQPFDEVDIVTNNLDFFIESPLSGFVSNYQILVENPFDDISFIVKIGSKVIVDQIIPAGQTFAALSVVNIPNLIDVRAGQLFQGIFSSNSAYTIRGTALIPPQPFIPYIEAMGQDYLPLSLQPSKNIIEITANGLLDEERTYRITAGTIFDLPSLVDVFNALDPFTIIIGNYTALPITINADGTDEINMPDTSTGSITIGVNRIVTLSSGTLDRWDILYNIDTTSMFLGKNLTTIFDSSSFNIQNPVGTDTPLKVEFGPAQLTGADPANLLLDGSVIFNQIGDYNVTFDLEYGRTGAAGVSELRLRAELGGVPIGPVLSASLENANVKTPIVVSFTRNITSVPVTLEVFLLRDSSGNNSGGLFPSVTTLVGWDDSPSARVLIEKFDTV